MRPRHQLFYERTQFGMKWAKQVLLSAALPNKKSYQSAFKMQPDNLIATKHEPWPYNGNASEKIVDAILDGTR